MKTAITVSAAALLIAAPVALAWPGPPTVAPPKAPDAIAPPPAWVETQATSRWLAYGSYCWAARSRRAVCVDMLPPATRPDLPRVPGGHGARLRVHLAFQASSAMVSVGGTKMAAKLDRNRRVISWAAAGVGVLVIDVRGSAGDARKIAALLAERTAA